MTLTTLGPLSDARYGQDEEHITWPSTVGRDLRKCWFAQR
jgi:hypothetical protein